MEENNMNQNYGEDNGRTDYSQSDNNVQYSGSQPDNGHQAGSYQTDGYQNSGYQNGGYQNSGYQNSGYQNSDYQNNSYQNGGYPDNCYQNSGYQNTYYPYNNTPPYQNGQVELEEPVKISEWVLSFVLMMIPCVNIIMMFVWAFSSTEKKSKSNFFKAYLIFFAIMMAFMVLVWLGILIIVMSFSK